MRLARGPSALLAAKLKWTLLCQIAYAVAAVAGDYLINGLLLGRAEVVTPVADLVLAPLIGGPVTFYLISQRFDLRRAMAERAALERELKQALSEAQVAARAKSDFLANMTHELRTPLNAVVGFASLLKSSRTLAPQDAHQVELVYEAGLSLLAVVNDVLDFSKLEAGPVTLEMRPFDPRALAAGCVRLVQGQARGKGLALDLAASEPIGPLTGDAMRLRQVMLNFLSNAIKFTERGTVTVRLAMRGAAPGRTLRVEVEDSGIGVPEDQRQAIFERFTQADAAIERRYGGTGLGLAISKKLIGAMGGRIGVDSAPGQGATFWFEVPAIPADHAPAHEAAREGGQAGEFGARILVADDNAVNRELIAAILKPLGPDLHFAVNGAEAVDAVARTPFDLILMDVQMPVMDGLTAARRIRAAWRAGQPRPPIIAMTANVLPEQAAACLAAGMDDHLGKPMQPKAVVAMLERWLQAAGGPAEQRARSG